MATDDDDDDNNDDGDNGDDGHDDEDDDGARGRTCIRPPARTLLSDTPQQCCTACRHSAWANFSFSNQIAIKVP